MPKVLTCSTCAAPLNLAESAQQTAVCSYCGSTLLLPEEMWGANTGSRWTVVPGDSVLAQAGAIAEIARLIRSNKKIEAIKIYRETFGVGLKEAKDAVERLQAGQPVSLISGSDPLRAAARVIQSQNAQEVIKKTVRPIVVIVVATVALGLIIALVAVAGGLAAFFSAVRSSDPNPRTTSTTPATTGQPASARNAPARNEFAEPVLEFGSEGIGAGQFDDVRSVAVDPEGRIYAGEYSSGRIQVFDPQGRFLTQWTIDRNRALLRLTSDRRGTIYVVHPGTILRLDAATGAPRGPVPLPASGSTFGTCTDAAFTLDSTLVVLDSSSRIAWFDTDGHLKNAIDASEKAGERISLRHMAVDGSGNIYCVDDVRDCVFQFGPDGRYINRFGGKDRFTSRSDQPGQLNSPAGIAVDGKGRVYIADGGIVVFDSAGRYLTKIGKGVVFGMAINDRNEVFATSRNEHKIVKYVVREESGGERR
ncbi:MAG TPA: ribosomal protein L7/L12 [Blastocatellia bacterium]|nr:ribosomal protein L7/L12 [Blastocatellia bacterium]